MAIAIQLSNNQTQKRGKNEKTQLGLILGLTSAFATLTSITPAQALNWTFNAASSTNPDVTITGSFTIDNESLGSGATVTASNIELGLVIYDNTAVITIGGVGSIDSISWDYFVDTNGCIAPCSLNLFFAPSLTNLGGTANLAAGTSFDQNDAEIGNSASDGGTTFAGGVTAAGGVTGRVPFNFKTTPGLIVLGLIIGGGKMKKHLPKIKKKIASLLGKK